MRRGSIFLERVLIEAVEIVVLVLVLVTFVLVIAKVLALERAAGLVGQLEALDQAIAVVFVQRHLLGDLDPVGGLEVIDFEQLVVDLG